MMNNNRNQLNRSLLAFAALQVMPLSLFAQGERPNILYIMCDDHAMQAISAYGSPISKLAKLDKICNELFRDIDKDTVDFVDNYDNTMKEPSLLPVAFPSVLVNTNTGIAVGMASSMLVLSIPEPNFSCWAKAVVALSNNAANNTFVFIIVLLNKSILYGGFQIPRFNRSNIF